MHTKRWILNVTLLLLATTLITNCSDTKPQPPVITCTEDSECPWEQYCQDGICVRASFSCNDTLPCTEGYVCRNGGCAPIVTDGGMDGDGGDGGDIGPVPCIEVVEPPLIGDPPTYQMNFGNVMVGVTLIRQLVLRNPCNADLHILQLNFEAGSGVEDFSIPSEQLNALPVIIASGKETTFDVVYTATDGLTDHGILDVISNDQDNALVKIHLVSEFKGDALAAVSPPSLNFGDVAVGEVSQPLSLTVLNQGTGNAVLTVMDVRFGILANPDFDLTVRDSGGQPAPVPALLNNGDFLEVAVLYHPQVRETDSDEVVVVTDDPTHQTLKVTLGGRGVLGLLEVQPSPVNMGRVRVGEHGENAVILKNNGGAPFSLTGVSLMNASTEWTLTSNDLDLATLSSNPRELAPAESVTVLLGFDPLDIGLEEGSLVIDNTTQEPQRLVTISASGYIPAIVETTPDPPALLFGNVQIDFNTGTAEKKILKLFVKNAGGEPLEIRNVQRGTMTSIEFGFGPVSIPPIAVGVEVPLEVSFQPADLGSENGSILVDTNAPDLQLDLVTGRFRIDLQANGIDPNIFVSPSSGHNFGGVYVGQQVNRDVTIRNAGTGPLEVRDIKRTPGSSPDFQLHNLPALPLVISNPMTEIVFQVSYTPDTLGPDTGAVQIDSSDFGNPTVILSLNGSGVGCTSGRIDCDGDPQNGCEIACVPSGAELCNSRDDDCDCLTDEDFNLSTDPKNCGVCGKVCSFPYAEAGCQNAICVLLHCASGYANCNTVDADGCEVNSDADVNNCGQCGKQCLFNHAGARCLAGTCIMESCDFGWANCNASNVDGCETDIWNDTANCGDCNIRCLYQNAVGRCLGGNCDLDSCLPGYANCDFNDANGCEINLKADPNNCNNCGNICPAAGGTPVCNNGACGVSSCNTGWADCDHDGLSCETNIANDLNNCGSCDFTCNLPHATASCSNSTCVVSSCSAGWGDCDNQDPNGCEIDVTSSVNNCGYCTNQCQFSHASAICQNSSCVMGGCDAGYYNIDNNPINGCECAQDNVADLCDDAIITDLGTLGGGQVRVVTGNLIPAGDEDWYTFSAPDNNVQDIGAGNDSYNLRIEFDPAVGNPDGVYAFDVYRQENPSATCAQKGNRVCAWADVTYDHNSGQAPCRGSGMTTSPGPPECHDDTSRYWVRVYRTGALVNCQSYVIRISFIQ